jgi:hypothetical protein
MLYCGSLGSLGTGSRLVVGAVLARSSVPVQGSLDTKTSKDLRPVSDGAQPSNVAFGRAHRTVSRCSGPGEPDDGRKRRAYR